MSKAFITLAYRLVIDNTATAGFEKQIWKASYEEYLLKSQAYNTQGDKLTFSQLKARDGRANSLHYKCGFSADGYLALLNKKIPGVRDETGQPVLFDTYRFEIIESDNQDINAHTVAVWFYTETLTLHAQFGEKILVTYGAIENDAAAENCFLVKLSDGLSVSRFRAVKNLPEPVF